MYGNVIIKLIIIYNYIYKYMCYVYIIMEYI